MNDFLLDDTPQDQSEPTITKIKQSWKILVVDDEEDVHSVTRMTLRGFLIDGRPLEIISAYSKAEAIVVLNKVPDIVLGIIDVVMESENAGLELVEFIRNDIKNQKIRLTLRTGQPGQAPEAEVIAEYDINDYKNKTELTSQKLRTLCYSAIRSYKDIDTIEKSRAGIRKVLETSSAVLKSSTLSNFATAVLQQVVTLLNKDVTAIYAISIPNKNTAERRSILIAATSDSESQVNDISFEDIPDKIKNRMKSAIDAEESQTFNDGYVTYLKTATGHQNLLSVNSDEQLGEHEIELLELYCANVSLTYEMLLKNEEVLDVQRQLVMLLGEAVESKSKETGAHVKRVALISEMLARDIGMDQSFLDIIKYSAPLHDIGKISIPDNILNKPGRLEKDEWEIMKTHAEVGGKILSQSKRAVFKSGTEIAANHHERWDGLGYPAGLKGTQIPIDARIVAIVDVFDALGSHRSYKEPWPIQTIREYILDQKNKMFDPDIVDVFIENFDSYAAIREIYPDEI